MAQELTFAEVIADLTKMCDGDRAKEEVTWTFTLRTNPFDRYNIDLLKAAIDKLELKLPTLVTTGWIWQASVFAVEGEARYVKLLAELIHDRVDS